MKKHLVRMLGLLVLSAVVASPALAAEIITAEDFKQFIVTETHLVRLADNAIFLYDASSSMAEEFRNTGKSKYELVMKEFTTRNSYFPEIGHTFGLYVYTPWKEMYPAQTYSRDKFAAALKALPKEPTGPTPLRKALANIEPVLKGLKGKTILYLFTDGTYSKGQEGEADDLKFRPMVDIANELAEKYNTCFYLISTAKEETNQKMLERVAEINACSRVIPLESFLDKPEYSSGALYEVKATESLVTVMEKRIVGLKVQNATFRFDKDNLKTDDLPELKEVAMFLKQHEEAYLVLRGYTDNVGKDEYNLELSKKRAMAVAEYLNKTFGIDESRMVIQWNGSANPIASNDTDEGRALNRRVEMLVTGL
jgi:OOP family OmpA-OmpF porin